jgi:hypothetical protein
MSRHFPGKYLDTSVEAGTAAGDRFMRAISTTLRYTYPSESYEVRAALDAVERYPDYLLDQLADKVENYGHEGMWAKTALMFIKAHASTDLLEGFLATATKENLTQTYTLYVRVARVHHVNEDPYMDESAKEAIRMNAIGDLADKISKYAMAVSKHPDIFPAPPLAGLTHDENGTIQLIMDNPSARLAIIDAIRDRSSFNVGFLQQVIAADSTVLSDGLL